MVCDYIAAQQRYHGGVDAGQKTGSPTSSLPRSPSSSSTEVDRIRMTEVAPDFVSDAYPALTEAKPVWPVWYIGH